MILSVKQGWMLSLFGTIAKRLTQRITLRRAKPPAEANRDNLQLETISHREAKDVGLEMQWDVERVKNNTCRHVYLP